MWQRSGHSPHVLAYTTSRVWDAGKPRERRHQPRRHRLPCGMRCGSGRRAVSERGVRSRGGESLTAIWMPPSTGTAENWCSTDVKKLILAGREGMWRQGLFCNESFWPDRFLDLHQQHVLKLGWLAPTPRWGSRSARVRGRRIGYRLIRRARLTRRSRCVGVPPSGGVQLLCPCDCVLGPSPPQVGPVSFPGLSAPVVRYTVRAMVGRAGGRRTHRAPELRHRQR